MTMAYTATIFSVVGNIEVQISNTDILRYIGSVKALSHLTYMFF